MDKKTPENITSSTIDNILPTSNEDEMKNVNINAGDNTSPLLFQ